MLHQPKSLSLAELFLRLFLLLPFEVVAEELMLLQTVGVDGDNAADGGLTVGGEARSVQQVLIGGPLRLGTEALLQLAPAGQVVLEPTLGETLHLDEAGKIHVPVVDGPARLLVGPARVPYVRHGDPAQTVVQSAERVGARRVLALSQQLLEPRRTVIHSSSLSASGCPARAAGGRLLADFVGRFGRT